MYFKNLHVRQKNNTFSRKMIREKRLSFLRKNKICKISKILILRVKLIM
jgi:hypothetical protein